MARKTQRKKAAAPAAGGGTGGWQLRPTLGQGPYTNRFQDFFTSKVEPKFYEFLVQTVPVLNAAIDRLVSLDGYLFISGDNAKLVDEIKDWFYNVPVNDFEKGVNAFRRALAREAHEQGFAFGEYRVNSKRNDIEKLVTADSKTVTFKRTAEGLEVYQRGHGDSQARLLDMSRILSLSYNSENGDSRGVPLPRSLEVVSKVVATMLNSLQNVWERFGDPSFSLVYKTSRKEGSDLVARKKLLEEELNTAVRAKREGKSADFVKAIDANSSIDIGVIGHEGQVLEIEMPWRAMIEQLVAKTGLPPWMFGLRWSSTQGLSNAEAEVILADTNTRQDVQTPLYYNMTRDLLLLRGRTWKPGDWKLEWAQVNLRDLVAQAQARFLNGQADMYYMQNAERAGIEISREDLSIGKHYGAKGAVRLLEKRGGTCDCRTHAGKELGRPQPWPELDKVEAEYEETLKTKWEELKEQTLSILKLSPPKQVKQDPPGIERFEFTEAQRAAVMKAHEDWIGTFDLSEGDSPVRWYYGQSYSLGLIQAARMVGQQRPILDIIRNREVYDELCRTGFQLLKDRATAAIVDRMLPEMQAQMLAGTNPAHVARRLENLFGAANADWERLARSEMSMAAERAKLDEWKERDVSRVEFTPAPDACAICMALAGDYDIGEAPIPVQDTHPRCRCASRPAAV